MLTVVGAASCSAASAPPLHRLCAASAPRLHSAPALHSAALHRLQRAPDLEVEIPEEPPPGTPAGGYSKLIFRKVVRGVPASMELNVARAMLPAMRFIASERSSFCASELPGVDE